MRNFYLLNQQQMKAKEKTIKFLLNFSKTMEIITASDKKFLISKN